MRPHSLSRRAFLARTAQSATGIFLASAVPTTFAQTEKRLKVAAIVTEFTYRSHAHVILENFTEPYLFNGEWIDPGMDVVSLYMDQVPANDLGHAFAEKFHIPIYKTIKEAL